MSDSAVNSTSRGAELPVLTVICQSLALLAAEGASLGLAGWSVRVGEPLSAYVLANVLPTSLRRFVVIDMAAGALAGLVLAGAVLAVRRRSGVETLRRLSFRLAPLSIAFIAPLLLNWQLWQGRAVQFLFLTGVFGLALQRLSRLALSTEAVFDGRGTALVGRLLSRVSKSEVAPFGVAVLAGAGYAAFFAFHTIRNHYRLGTASLDLGLETNLVWNALHGSFLFKASPLGGPTTTHAGYHQTYFAYLLGIPFWFSQKAETLLAIQAVFMGAAAIPLYFLAKRKLAPWVAALLSVLYVFYAPLHGANLYDFHYLPLGTFFLWTTLYLLLERRYRWAAVLVVLTLSVREDISALLAVVGGYLLLTGKRPVAGLVVSVVGAAYFVIVKLVVMPRFLGGADSFAHQYILLIPEGDKGFSGILKTVLANLPFTLGTLLDKEKLSYLLQIVVPFAFFPWRRAIGILCTVPGFFFTLLATNYPPLIQTSFQYTAYWTTFFFIAVIDNLEFFVQAEKTAPSRALEFRASRQAWLVAMTASMMITSHEFGALFQQHTVRGGFGQYRFDLTEADRERHARLYKLIALVPPRAKIVSSELVVPQVASRPDSYTFRNGMYDAEYFIAWMAPRDDERGSIADSLKSGKFGVVAVEGEFILAKKGFSTTRNAEIIGKYHL